MKMNAKESRLKIRKSYFRKISVIRLVIAISLAFVSQESVFAYKPGLHQKFTEKAYSQSTNFINAVDNEWGDEFKSSNFDIKVLKTRDTAPDDIDDFKEAKSDVSGVLQYGALWEDDKKPSIAINARPFNHFYDPQQGIGARVDIPLWKIPQVRFWLFINPFSDPLSTVPLVAPGAIIGNTSPDWILEDKRAAERDIWPMFFEEQQYSYKKARDYMVEAFTAELPLDRHNAIGKMYQSLGHVLHHVQDMGQPQHTRNDMHCDDCSVYSDFSKYEEVTGKRENIDSISKETEYMNRLTYRSEPVILGHPREYWENNDHTGMAQFTSENFVTTESNYFVDPFTEFSIDNIVEHLINDSFHPLPDKHHLTVSFESLSSLKVAPLFEVDISPTVDNAKMIFIGRDILDPLTGKTVAHNRMATYSVFSKDLAETNDYTGGLKALTVNQFNHMERIPILFPRIVAFSSGMLDYFSRVKVRLIANGDDTLTIVNLTNSEGFIDGEFEIYKEDTNGQRTHWKTIPATLDFNESVNVEIEGSDISFLSDAQALVLVFTGEAGREGDGTDRLTAVGGYYLEHDFFLPCTDKIIDGEGDWWDTFDMGTQPGEIVLQYDAHGSEDAFALVYNGVVVDRTDGRIQNDGELKFDYDPANNGTSVEVHVDSRLENSGWNFALRCPGYVEPEPEPEVICGSSGGSGSSFFTEPYLMGSKPGTVTLTFDAYSLQDEFVLTHGETVVASTDGFVSGKDSISFEYNPDDNSGGQLVWVFIVSQNGGSSAFEFTLSCPN